MRVRGPSIPKKVSVPKVAKPRARPSDASLFPHVTKPKLQPLKTRVYTKDVLREDPSKFGEFGFDGTGK